MINEYLHTSDGWSESGWNETEILRKGLLPQNNGEGSAGEFCCVKMKKKEKKKSFLKKSECLEKEKWNKKFLN